MSEGTSRIAIVGAGSVGATIAYACMIRGVGQRIVLYDVDKTKVDAQTLDLNHGLLFTPMATIEGSDDVAICKDADIVVITAGAKQKPGQTRLDLADTNAGICRTLVPALLGAAPNAIYLLVTNPVDVITYITLKLSGLAPSRVFGSGTVLDSSRFRFLLAQRLGVAVQNVHAYIAGEHGDSEVPLWSSATIAGIPVVEWSAARQGKLNSQEQLEIFQNVRTAAYQIVRGKGATNYAVGLAAAKIIESVLHDENAILPVSSLLTGYRGLSDVCLSVPCVVNRTGVQQTLAVPMSPDEEAGLKRSAETIREVVRSLGF
jgi:L-lactate dehydrogenase